MNLKIKTKLLLLFFALAVFPLMAIGIVSYHNSVRAVEEVVEQRSAAAIEQAAADVRAFFAPRPYEIQLLAWNQEVQDLYSSYKEKGSAATRKREAQRRTWRNRS